MQTRRIELYTDTIPVVAHVAAGGVSLERVGVIHTWSHPYVGLAAHRLVLTYAAVAPDPHHRRDVELLESCEPPPGTEGGAAPIDHCELASGRCELARRRVPIPDLKGVGVDTCGIT